VKAKLTAKELYYICGDTRWVSLKERGLGF